MKSLFLKLLSGDFFQILVAFSEYLNFTRPTFAGKGNAKIKALKTEVSITSMDSGSQLVFWQIDSEASPKRAWGPVPGT